MLARASAAKPAAAPPISGPEAPRPTPRHRHLRLTRKRPPGSAFLNICVSDIGKAYQTWVARGAEFLTEPKDRGYEHQHFLAHDEAEVSHILRDLFRGM